MPCTGPSKTDAYALGDQITDELLSYLQVSYSISRPYPEVTEPKRDPVNAWETRFNEDWDKLEKQLRDTIRELVWNDWASSF